MKKHGELVRKIEQQHQIAVAQYLRAKYPKIKFTIAPNGFKLPIGVAVQLKKMGYSAGTPDIMIFAPRNGSHALFIEMKTPKGEDTKKGVLSKEQKEWLEYLGDLGYAVSVCYGSQEAYKVIDEYFK